MITLEKVIHVFQELLEEDPTIEIITLKQGYFVVSWQPRIHRYDFSPLCPTLEALTDMLTAYYAEHLRLKELAHDKESDEEKGLNIWRWRIRRKQYAITIRRM